jgi:hypothetical protein
MIKQVNKGMKLKIQNEKAFFVNLDECGNIEKIFYGNQLWNGYPGNLEIIDELHGKIFRSANANNTQKILTENKNTLTFEKSWHDCDFIAREIWTAFEDCLSWRIEVSLRPGCAERSIRIKQLFPYPHPAYNLYAWSANERFPCALETLGGLHLYYGDACYGTVIPAVTLYDTEKNIGFTLAKPFDMKSARLAFYFMDYHSEGITIENTNFYLGNGKPAVAELLIRAHEGCWRPGLGWLYHKYPEYFDPPNSQVYEFEGGFMITNPYTRDSYLKKVSQFGYKYNVKWAEIHNHFPCYGDYAPTKKEWDSVIRHDYPEVSAPKEKLSVEKINRHVQSLHENNIKGLLYFQCTGDAFVPFVEKHFLGSVARDAFGKKVPTWKDCCFANASPETAFGKHINRQIDKLVADYPDIDGVFVDQMCYQMLDSAHHDGVTACSNKPAAMFGYSYEENLKKLSAILHSQGKVIWGNGPFNVEVQKNIDGIMAEGVSGIAETYKYLCLTKPLLVHTYPDKPENIEKMFRHCLLCGGSYSIGASSKLPEPEPIEGKAQEVFARCIPLVEKLFNRKWVFAATPLKIPAQFDGNIFYTDNGDGLLITLVSKYSRLVDFKYNIDRNIEIIVNIKKLKSVNCVESFSCHTGKKITVDFDQTEDLLKIKIHEHSVMSVIVVK